MSLSWACRPGRSPWHGLEFGEGEPPRHEPAASTRAAPAHRTPPEPPACAWAPAMQPCMLAHRAHCQRPSRHASPFCSASIPCSCAGRGSDPPSLAAVIAAGAAASRGERGEPAVSRGERGDVTELSTSLCTRRGQGERAGSTTSGPGSQAAAPAAANPSCDGGAVGFARQMGAPGNVSFLSVLQKDRATEIDASFPSRACWALAPSQHPLHSTPQQLPGSLPPPFIPPTNTCITAGPHLVQEIQSLPHALGDDDG